MPSWKKVIVSGSDASLNSLNVATNVVAQSFTGSLFGTASFAVSSSHAIFADSSSYAITASYVNPLSQTVVISGSARFDPTQDPDPTGLDLDSTYLFQSASNTSLGYDLYFRQNGNLVKWKWVEGMLESGLLYGGVVTYSGSNVFVSSGSGIIVDHNAITGSEISPMVDYITWGPITQSIVNITSSQVTYLYIDGAGALQQQDTRFTSEQYHNYIPLGAVGHFDYANVNAFGGAVRTSYDQVSQLSDFVDAFGPLKVSGYGINGQPGSLRVSVSSGRSFIHGGFYPENPEFPSNFDTNAQATASIAYVYRSGSGVAFDTNSGNLYTALRPGFYDDGSGTPAVASGGSYTIQRIFSDPKTGVLYIYYGQNEYSTLSQALTNLSTDSFTEGDTFDFTTFLGFIIVKGNTTDITIAADAKIIPAGLFRGSGGGSGGGGGVEALDDLSDVTIVSPVNGQALVYNSGIWQNGYPTSASFATTASFSSTSTSASFSTTATTASFALTASILQNNSAKVSSSTAICTSGSTLLYNLSEFKGAMMDYVVSTSGSGTSTRAGTFTAVWNSVFSSTNEVTTMDIGNTDAIHFSADSTGSIFANVTTGSWVVDSLYRALGTAVTIPIINCSTGSSYSGGQAYPTEQFVNLGTDTGTVVLNYNAISVPDRFIVEWDGSVVIDTGYRGGANYDFGGGSRSAFTSSLAGKIDPITLNTYPDLTTYPNDGYPRILGLGSGTTSFVKNLATPTPVTVKVYGPMAGTAWSYTLNCPSNTTTTTTTAAPTTTTTTTAAPTTTTTTTAAPTIIPVNFYSTGTDAPLVGLTCASTSSYSVQIFGDPGNDSPTFCGSDELLAVDITNILAGGHSIPVGSTFYLASGGQVRTWIRQFDNNLAYWYLDSCQACPATTTTTTTTAAPTTTTTTTSTTTTTAAPNLFTHGTVLATCSDYCTANYDILTSTSADADYFSLGIGDTIYAQIGSGYVAYSNVPTDTSTGPFRVAQIDGSGVVIGITECSGGSCVPI